MRRTITIVGLLAMFLVAVGAPGLSVSPVRAAEMMQTDKAMHQATGEELMKLKEELELVQAELQKLTARIGSMSRMAEKATSNYCKSIPSSLRAAGFAPGLCE